MLRLVGNRGAEGTHDARKWYVRRVERARLTLLQTDPHPAIAARDHKRIAFVPYAVGDPCDERPERRIYVPAK